MSNIILKTFFYLFCLSIFTLFAPPALAVDSSEHLTMGNPTGAVQDINQPNNYLLPKTQFVMSYNRDRAIPNWVSWHLNINWLGTAPRQDNFRSDTSLPAGWYRVVSSDYTGSGFNRGHLTPSADRTFSIEDNSTTFLMTNMFPQAPDNNQGPWEKLEDYCRVLVNQGNELYVVAGGAGDGGTGSSGAALTIAGGKIAVPQTTWKVVLVLPNGDNDVTRVGNSTRAFAVIMPNAQGIRNNPWEVYAATVDQVEALTGYDFFSNVPPEIQSIIEARLGAAPTAARVSISGRVSTPQSFGLVNARVTLTDLDGNSRTVMTHKFGNFRFNEVAAGQTYVLTVASKRYTYAAQIITPTEDMTELIFTPY